MKKVKAIETVAIAEYPYQAKIKNGAAVIAPQQIASYETKKPVEEQKVAEVEVEYIGWQIVQKDGEWAFKVTPQQIAEFETKDEREVVDGFASTTYAEKQQKAWPVIKK